MKTYTVNEIFYSIQGEGMRAGTANVFIRFSGCNQTCTVESHGFDCDTEFVSGRKMTATEILEEARRIAPACEWVVLTGGEPGLQIDQELIDVLHQHFLLAIETNGSIQLPDGIDWITVSPKVAEHAIRQMTASEVKYVRGYGQGLPKPALRASYYYLSPAFAGMDIDPEALAWCVQLVKENPRWQLSVQQHKAWKIR